MLHQIALYGLSGLIAYCIGSVSTGILSSRLGHGPDLRKVGSKNTGASNVQRTMGWKWGIITFLGDSLKAVLACWIGQLITGSHFGALFCGLAVIVGHNWPVFFQFKGGKGVASSCGVMVFCFPLPAVICFVLTVALIAVTKYISLGSMTMLTLYAILVSCFFSGGNLWIIGWSVLLAVMCICRHHANIGRLLRGEENKIGQKVKS
ncbi:MAG: glycerol-3-phosphate 1-O-acyltransferase PlsY [Clostridia bacterium]|nr:glycerol-3-phosphate 1-O-acyltransferase PlsY [Clostridia bacterium]